MNAFGRGTPQERLFRELATAMGVPSMRAKGEVEAEFAYLCRDGHLYGVLRVFHLPWKSSEAQSGAREVELTHLGG